MSYSRWGESRFYCYWAASEGLTKEKEVFEICGLTNFTYKELKNHMNDCLDAAIELEEQDALHHVTPAEKEGLRDCMVKFIEDIERYYARENR